MLRQIRRTPLCIQHIVAHIRRSWPRKVIVPLSAWLLVVTLGVYAPLICILHCHHELFGSRSAPLTVFGFVCVHSVPEAAAAPAARPVLPQPLYPLVPVAMLLLLTLRLMLRQQAQGKARFPVQWSVAPLTPPPRG